MSRFPDLRFVVDHISKPLIRDGVLSPWDDNIRDLARFENVTCKLSGMVTEADWDSWKPDDLEPVDGPELPHTAIETQRGDSRVVDLGVESRGSNK